MRYSLLTPTILRESLVRLCASIDAQTSNDWEHVVVVDTPLVNDVLSRISHPRRVVLRCDHQHGDWGHHCRHNVWPTLTGDAGSGTVGVSSMTPASFSSAAPAA